MKRTLTVGVAVAAFALAFGGAHPAAAAPSGPEAALAAALGLDSQEKLVVRDAFTAADGNTYARYDRTWAGLPVLGGDLVVQRGADGALRGVDGNTARVRLSGTRSAVAAPAGARQVVWAGTGAPVLAWEAVTTGVRADGTPSRVHRVTDATTGAALTSWDDIRTLTADGVVPARGQAGGKSGVAVAGTGKSFYSGTVALETTQSGGTYQLKDPTRGNQQVNNLNRATSGAGTLLTDADNAWGDGTNADAATAGVDAAYGAAQTWDYYKNVHGRNGIKNNGVGALSRVHYGNNYVNAFWDNAAFQITYGDGASNTHPLTSLDVAGHEFSHGVTSATANLNYAQESGGLNEATSDIFGTAVEFNSANASDVGDYLIGEKIDIFGNGKPLRYQDKPSKDGQSPDYWDANLKNLDVHYSSGVANHFFYLLAEGSGPKVINGVSYDSPTFDNQPVTGIGRAKAEKIWFAALTTKFTSTTDYAAARVGTLAATSTLYGATSPEYAAVARAWTAVNVQGATPPGKYFENLTNVNVPDKGAAVFSNIAVTGVAGNAPATLKVGVDIKHTYRGDLVIDLVAPDGSTYRLKDSSGSDSADNVVATYTVNASSEVANGTWKLKVQDVYAADTGYIDAWNLTF
ncbi:M4 family metallopeptidase [Longispora sp. NPDC051575]|uniref:M4 family metallopeptidase n=1 Tax=Longispora sp. NPDC051575 TaxID=3154943 RepID=UPI00341C1CFF